jgi:hypothetical protein
MESSLPVAYRMRCHREGAHVAVPGLILYARMSPYRPGESSEAAAARSQPVITTAWDIPRTNEEVII